METWIIYYTLPDDSEQFSDLICFLLNSIDDTHVAKEKAKADAEFYKVQKEIEANSVCTVKLSIHCRKNWNDIF